MFLNQGVELPDTSRVIENTRATGYLKICRFPLTHKLKEFPVPFQAVEDSERGAPRFEPAVKAREEGFSSSLTIGSETTRVSFPSCEVRRTP